VPRSSHLRLPALVASTTLSLSGLVVLASAVPASAAVPAPVCDATSCTITYDYDGAVQPFTVPEAVTELDVRVSGASGGNPRAPLRSPGGEGGTTRATMSVVPGASLRVLVGQSGAAGGSRTVGGGGATASISYTASGGGGSFVFLDDGTPAVVSGGGGGGAGASSEPDYVPGGAGAGAGSAGGDGSTLAFYNPSSPARGGSATSGGAGGTNRIPSDGVAGGGPSTDYTAGPGGDGGHYAPWAYYDGGGGGGGYYGGGGGGTGDSGAGGSGYAAPDVSVVTSTVGGRTGNGVVTIGWARLAQPVSFTSDAGNPRVGETYQVAATGGASGNAVTFGSDTPDVCTVSGSTVSLQQVGTCTVRADQAGTDSYQAGTAAQSASVRGDSAVSITSTAPDAVVDGPAYDVVVSSSPSTGAVSLSTSASDACSISDSTVSFEDVGQCTITATQASDANYDAGTDSQTFTVGKGTQTINFTSEAPSGTHPEDTFDVAATGGASDQAVTFASATPGVCSIDGATVTLLSAGTCTITADQDGDDRFDPALTAQQDTTVSQVASAVVLTLPESMPVTGQTVTVQAAATAGSGTATGSVQFSVDGDDLGEPTDLASGNATSASFDLSAGEHEIGVTYLPEDDVRFAESSTSETLVVEPAATDTVITTDGQTLHAEVTPTDPGEGTPSGDVTFRVDGVDVGTGVLDEGIAELEHPLANGSDHGLSAEYVGSDDFLASSGSTSRNDPTITAALGSASSPSAAGWYRTPVTITYTCTPRGADLATPCPEPVTVSEEGAAQAFSATVNAVDGGVATVSSVVNLDRTAPTVKVRGVRDGAAYLGVKPRPRCQAADGLSGVLSCKVIASRGSYGRTVLTGTAVDRAGNVARDRVSYQVNRRNLVGSTWHNGAWEVRRGRTYTLAALAGVRPRFVRAVPGAGRPRHLGAWFNRSGSAAGVKRWTRGVTMSMPVSRTRIWTVGVKDGRGLHRIKVRVIG
jgi:hypothetical protein